MSKTPGGYAQSKFRVREDLSVTHFDMLESFACSGTWWTGVERRAIATEARAARDCALCSERKAELSPIASHSSSRALVDTPRNLSDETLRAIAKNGGVVMINFGDTFIDPRKATRWGVFWDVASHLGA